MSKRVVIVGAGVVGLFCALRLAKAGAQVVVLEAEREDFTVYGPTASLAAAGMLAPLTEDAGDDEVQGLALDAFDLWRRLTPGAPWQDGVRFDGGVAIGAPEALLARAAALGRKASALNAAQFRKRTGLEARIDAALFVEDEGVADPIRVLSGLAMDARRHGVQIVFSADAAEVSAECVRTHEGGTYAADAVVLAPGVWATEALTAAAPALKLVRPAKGQLVPVSLARPLAPNLHGPGFYLARRMDDDVVLGATMEFDRSDRHPVEARAAELLAAAEQALPGEVTRRDRGWAGVRPMSPDGAPMVGKSGAVWIAAGHSRNGWLYAPLTAEILTADLMGGEPPSPLWKRFSPDRFNP